MRLREQSNSDKSGFTIIELIVVIAIIAILATISILGYGAWRNNTIATQVKSDLSNAASALENYRTFNNGYPALTGTVVSGCSATAPATSLQLVITTLTPSKNDCLTLSSDSTAAFYCVDGYSSDNPTDTYYLASTTKDQGALSGTCATRPGQTLPGVPTGLATTTVASTTVGLTWTAGSGGTAASYTAQCASDGAFILNFGQTVVTSTTGTVTGLAANTTYYCRVKATNGAGDSAWSNTTSATTQLAVPSGLAVSTTSTTVIGYSFASVAGAASYNVQKSGNIGFTSPTVHSQTILTGSFTGMSAGNPYYFRVQAVDSNSVPGPWSPIIIGATLPSGVVGWWQLDGNPNDSSGNANNGVASSGATLTAGQNGQANNAFNFDGISGQIMIPDSVTLSQTSAITVSAWVKAQGLTGAQVGIVSKDISSGISNPPYALDVATTGFIWTIDNSANTTVNVICSEVTPVNGTWYNVVGTFSSTTMNIYINGTQCTETGSQTNMADSTGLLRIGQQKDTFNRWLTGVVDDVRVYNVALPLATIQAVYNAGAQ